MSDIYDLLLLSIAAFLCAFFLTFFVRSYALKRSLIDIPNERSSHKAPIPRGGGVAFVVTFLLFISFIYFLDELPRSIFLTFAGSGGLVALVGFLDDHEHIAARWRLLAHFIAAAWAIFWLQGLPALPVFGLMLDLGKIGYFLAAVYLVWLLNLFNFMDGVDGIASIEAISVIVGGVLLLAVMNSPQNYLQIPLILASATLGFLFWNLPPARIFMGDAGSGFLGIILGIFSIQAAWVSPQLFWSWLILLGVFIVDATVTLVRRVLHGEKIYLAHRSHAYQYASRKYDSHLRVTLSVLAINILWLCPIAYLVAMESIEGVLGVLLAYIPLIVLALTFKAGARSEK